MATRHGQRWRSSSTYTTWRGRRSAASSLFWSAYVASKANLADIPTRMERESEIPAGIPQSEFVLAPLDWDAFTLVEWALELMERTQTLAGAQGAQSEA